MCDSFDDASSSCMTALQRFEGVWIEAAVLGHGFLLFLARFRVDEFLLSSLLVFFKFSFGNLRQNNLKGCFLPPTHPSS